MSPSPPRCGLGPWRYSPSRPQRVHLCYGPVTRSLPWGDLVDRLQSFSFHHLCYPNYGALTSTPAGLSPAEHASLRWTHNRTCRDHRPDVSAALTTVAFDQSGPRWLGTSDLIAEPEGPTFISYKVARSRLDRLRFVTQDPSATLTAWPS